MNKSLRAKEILGKHISRQRLARQFQLPPERELAKQLGYSRATVSKALGVLEGEGVIFRKKGSGTFITAHNCEHTLTIAVIMRNAYEYTDIHFRPIIEETQSYAEKNRICIQIYDHAVDIFKKDPDNNPLIQAIRNKMVDGVLVISRMPISILSKISALCPVVSINNPLGDGEEIPCVSCNYFLGGFLAGKYLFEKGHRKVAYITEDHNNESVLEFSGFKAAMDICGVKLTKYDFLETKKNPNIFNRRVIAFFKKSNYTACFFRHINYVSRMISPLENNGIKVPENLSVITAGDRNNCKVNKLNLTIIDNRLIEACDIGLRMLQDMTVNNNKVKGGIKLLTPHIIENDSVIDLN